MRKLLCRLFMHLWVDNESGQVCAWCGETKARE